MPIWPRRRGAGQRRSPCREPHGSRGRARGSDRSRALVVWNMNPLASCPNQSRLRVARARRLFTVAVELFPTDSTALADYVLPAASFLEFDDIVAPYFHLCLSAQVKAMPPPGQALPNLEIFRRLGRAMGFAEPEFRESDAEILETLMARSGLGQSFASLRTKGMISVPRAAAVQFADRKFATPSGRIEAASERRRRTGCRDCPSAAATRGRRRGAAAAVAGAPLAAQHDIRQRPKNQARLGPGRASCSIRRTRRSAALRGRAGDGAQRCGRLGLEVALSDDVPCGVAVSHKGRWLGGDAGHANVNVLESREQERHGREHGGAQRGGRGGGRGAREVGGGADERRSPGWRDPPALARVLGSRALRARLHRAVRAADHARLRVEGVERPDRARVCAGRRVHVLHRAQLRDDDRGAPTAGSVYGFARHASATSRDSWRAG